MDLHRKLAKLFKYEIIKLKKHPTLCSHLMNMIRLHGIDTVLDVGANDGQFGKMLRDEGYSGEIHSFEPVSGPFENLKQASLGDSKWFAYQLGMGDVTGEQTVHIAKMSVFSSFLNPNAFGETEFQNEIDTAGRETVAVGTIHEFLPRFGDGLDRRRIFLKMDTQGYDLNVFKGALPCIAHIRFILSEISMMPIYEGMPYYLDALKEYESGGFAVTGLYPVTRRSDFSIIEMDCVLVNKRYSRPGTPDIQE